MAGGPGALSPSFSGRSGPVSQLSASSRVVAESLSGGVAAPGEGPAPLAGAPVRGQRCPCSVARAGGGGGWMADPLLRAPSRPRSLYLPPVSPVIPVLVGTHHSPISRAPTESRSGPTLHLPKQRQTSFTYYRILLFNVYSPAVSSLCTELHTHHHC